MSTVPGTDSSRTEAAATRYFDAIAARDVDGMVACWKAGAVDHVAPVGALRAPDGLRAYFAELFAAFPDLRYEVVDMIVDGDRVAVRWRARGTFSGRPFDGIAPTGARAEIEGIDLGRIEDGLLVENYATWDDAAVARQLGLLPARGSAAERGMKAAFNARTRLAAKLRRRRAG